MSYTIVLSRTGKILRVKNESDLIKELGPNGWGTLTFFEDELGDEVLPPFFKKADKAPTIWTGADRPLYLWGHKIPDSRRIFAQGST